MHDNLYMIDIEPSLNIPVQCRVPYPILALEVVEHDRQA
jgi:hypothetical protein